MNLLAANSAACSCSHVVHDANVGQGACLRRFDHVDPLPVSFMCGTLGTSGHGTVKSSICDWGVLYKSDGYARKTLCLTPGGRHGVRVADRVCVS